MPLYRLNDLSSNDQQNRRHRLLDRTRNLILAHMNVLQAGDTKTVVDR